MNSYFETKRLIAERFKPDHLEWLTDLHQNPEVMKTLGGVRDNVHIERDLKEYLKHWEDYGYGFYRVLLKDSQEPIGRMGLRLTEIDAKEEVELAYTITDKHWGRGYATEISQKLIEMIPIWELPIGELICFTTPENPASQQVMKKLGFEFERKATIKGFDCVLFRYSYL